MRLSRQDRGRNGPVLSSRGWVRSTGMEALPAPTDDLAVKITRLVQERGWNQEEFARIARLNRHTVRQILHPGGRRRLRNATISACARALGLSVNDLRTHPLEQPLPRLAEGP